MKTRLFLYVAMAVLLLSSFVRADDKYMINIDVDVTAEDASKAREKAMIKANRQAFFEVVRKNTDSIYYDRFMNFTDEQILNFIKEVGVSEEKSSSYRYAARLQVLVDGELLLEYMRENSIPATYKNSTYDIIIPVYYAKDSEKPLLWEDENHWRYIWEQKGIIQRGQKNFLSVPATDENKNEIAAGDEKLNRRIIAELTENNPANNVYIVILRSDIYSYLNIDIINAKTGDKSDIKIYGTENEKNFNIAADMVIARLQGNVLSSELKEETVFEPATNKEIVVIYENDNPSDVLEIRKKFERLPEIKKVSLLTAGNGKVSFSLEILSSPEQAAYAISRTGYRVAKEDNVYVINKVR